ncbi:MULTISPECIES: hypothetical protein [Halomonas]|uniref:YfhG lipoprotein n=1 Tax=Halomonas flagellata TaxID=2920385 RepID=A0ABS9RQG0_9GAMM|nr:MULTISPECIES: hypothetical protein [Halomonas]MCH4562052.1 hypothetical protein [Halomonas flagellata]PXX98281.1 hypothetical protein CR157_08115 [Halomonas sp. LBP4]
MKFRPLLACLAVTWLAGCELLPEQPRSMAPKVAQPAAKGCHAVIPDFDDEACLLPDWVAFGLASQRGERNWRDVMLSRLAGEAKERRLARAVLLAWGNENQWDRASELFKADLHTAPAALQPLLRYWLNEVEGRRAMAGRLASSQEELAAMEAENAALAEKLEALTAIEQNINLRQQND